MSYFRTCQLCGCNLDPGEQCDCMERSNRNKRKYDELLDQDEFGQFCIGSKSLKSRQAENYRKYEEELCERQLSCY